MLLDNFQEGIFKGSLWIIRLEKIIHVHSGAPGFYVEYLDFRIIRKKIHLYSKMHILYAQVRWERYETKDF